MARGTFLRKCGAIARNDAVTQTCSTSVLRRGRFARIYGQDHREDFMNRTAALLIAAAFAIAPALAPPSGFIGSALAAEPAVTLPPPAAEAPAPAGLETAVIAGGC